METKLVTPIPSKTFQQHNLTFKELNKIAESYLVISSKEPDKGVLLPCPGSHNSHFRSPWKKMSLGTPTKSRFPIRPPSFYGVCRRGKYINYPNNGKEGLMATEF